MKSILSFFFLFFLQLGFAQNKQVWQGYFSYNDIHDLSISATTVYAASENALFSKDLKTDLLKTTTTIDGLSGQTIAALFHSSVSNKSIIGYENGLMIVINDADGSMINIVDIINKQIPSNLKKINHFMEYNGIVYVSCNFGIVQFNLSTMLFGDTYFIGNNGAELSVTQTAVYNGFIYASTSDGIRKADISSKNLIDYNQWISMASGNWSSVEAFGTELLAITTAGNVYKYSTNTNYFYFFLQLPQASSDMRSTEDYLIITTLNTVYIYNKQLVLVRKIDSSQIGVNGVNFICAASLGDKIFIGTKENGMYSTTISLISNFENIMPSGPSRNSIFSVLATSNSLWAAYGDYTAGYNPYPLDSFGISKYSEKGWLNIPYEKVLGAKSIVRIAVSPLNENLVYASSFYSGVLKIENEVPTLLYNKSNSKLEDISSIPGYFDDTRINGIALDAAGNLWVNNSLVKNGLKELKTDGQWISYSTKDILGNPEASSLGRLIIDKLGTKWFCSNGDGVVGYNEKYSKFKKMTFGPENGNLPTTDAKAIAVDNGNQLWIGTVNGLRVLRNIGDFQSTDQLRAEAIIILEDNVAQELLYEQAITDIAVDGANNKWIGTGDSGVFLVSPDGQETKYHFTIKNSPLPSNTINDIDINNVTGEVFIATDKGMVSFKGIATKANEDLNNAYVYPNPVRPEYEGTVKIAGLLDRATVKITDIEGNLVFETTSQGGTIEWDTTAFGKYKVASGVYMIFISAQDGIETKVKKVMIIR